MKNVDKLVDNIFKRVELNVKSQIYNHEPSEINIPNEYQGGFMLCSIDNPCQWLSGKCEVSYDVVFGKKYNNIDVSFENVLDRSYIEYDRKFNPVRICNARISVKIQIAEFMPTNPLDMMVILHNGKASLRKELIRVYDVVFNKSNCKPALFNMAGNPECKTTFAGVINNELTESLESISETYRKKKDEFYSKVFNCIDESEITVMDVLSKYYLNSPQDVYVGMIEYFFNCK